MAAKRIQRKQFVPIGNVLETVLRKYRPATDASLLKVWEVWPQAVGPMIVDHAKPAAFKGDLLLVHVDASTWLHHLSIHEQELCRKINHLLGGDRVKRIKFKIGPL
ncbi:DUF721 domain-containing protein [Desulfatitalea alkaliphila]|uniref:DUF721 domain-containing protein n=1 Tax=Desulfatitalea alkaliphila TaxID=2929485 RepID=A0AA41R6Q3_9BACT|nr:DUF721 domain-containing protein [Desulfatitalea alkaliphila]MCJ8501941.1 DUF721 domain-containing protein [Desulfatitalea alkaliphila]